MSNNQCVNLIDSITSSDFEVASEQFDALMASRVADDIAEVGKDISKDLLGEQLATLRVRRGQVHQRPDIVNKLAPGTTDKNTVNKRNTFFKLIHALTQKNFYKGNTAVNRKLNQKGQKKGGEISTRKGD